jgi:Probable cobalt transporter subunit (CbtA)
VAEELGDVERFTASLAAGAVFVAIVVAAAAALPSIDEVPPTLPAALLWKFRISALGVHAVRWTGIGLLFGEMVEYGASSVALPTSLRKAEH